MNRKAKLFVVLDLVLVVLMCCMVFLHQQRYQQRLDTQQGRLAQLLSLLNELETVDSVPAHADSSQASDTPVNTAPGNTASVAFALHVYNPEFWEVLLPQVNKYELPACMLIDTNETRVLNDSVIQNLLRNGWEIGFGISASEDGAASLTELTEAVRARDSQPALAVLDAGTEAAGLAAQAAAQLAENEIPAAGVWAQDMEAVSEALGSEGYCWTAVSLENSTEDLKTIIQEAEQTGSTILLTDYSLDGQYTGVTVAPDESLLEWLKNEQDAGNLSLTALSEFDPHAAAESESAQEEKADQEPSTPAENSQKKSRAELMKEVQTLLNTEEKTNE